MQIASLWAITVALSHEAKSLLPKLKVMAKTVYRGARLYEAKLGEKSIILLQTGMGPGNAYRSASFLFSQFPVSHLITTGYCGALQAGIKNGAAILGNELFSSSSREKFSLFTNQQWTEECKAKLTELGIEHHCGAMLESKSPVLSPAKKQQLGQQYQALSVDMESFSVLKAAQKNENITSLALRFVVDAMDDNLVNTESFVDPQEGLLPGRLVREAIRRPKLLIELPQLERLASLARRNLEKSLVSILNHI